MTELSERVQAAYAGSLSREDGWAATQEAMALLDRGQIRVAEKGEAGWIVHEWVKQAVLLWFRYAEMVVHDLPPFQFYDKVPLKRDLAAQGVRVVPPGTVRYGAYLERGCVVMPGYVNVGAYVGAGTMVDTWATVGSCAQIGKNVHLSGGVGIGGVLEPLSARPVIIEDGCFIGSRAIVVEGVIVEEEAVLGANVVLTASTPILDVTGPQEVEHRGRVPARSVVIPGTRAKRFPAGEYHTPCALIIGQRKASTDKKTSLNEVLREHAVSV
ncbi:MAG: 2,3,4,5-tetrahydropyridine-2,6-dicarboxylate N-succinyltransferase [Deltaproteobacteria bacterium]|nr:2,3,4,5-tetrahydropyridine-2,6-dicarboxylate N-succinyltransferase [Deltaproteobacteria bacterium]MBK9645329.1 2,3,4,5-tetrahydropyridine-2,6-dicarboxylate N-succinyltransferase [Deltaproteobacteria bacterium]